MIKRQLSKTLQLFYFGLGFGVLLHVGNAQSPIDKAVWPVLPLQDVDVTRARPLQDALYMVEARLHAAIGYEQGAPNVTSMIVPGSRTGQMMQKVEHLHVHFAQGMVDPLSAVRTAVEAYDNGSSDHKFVVGTDGNLILVYPQANPLSLRDISIDNQRRTLDQIAQVITDRIGQAAGRQVKIWTGQFNDSTLFDFGAQNEAISSVLARYTRLRGGSGGYWLMYHPSQDCYYLSLKFLMPPPQVVNRKSVQPSSNVQNPKPTDNNPFFVKSNR